MNTQQTVVERKRYEKPQLIPEGRVSIVTAGSFDLIIPGA